MAEVGNLTAKLTLDTAEFDKGISGVESQVSKFAGGIGKALGGVAAGVTAAVGAAAAGVASLVKESVAGFAAYEQLTGGVETLFKESAGIVQDYAMEAYKTAGISANQYMETVTSFSASLLQSLGGNTAEAARIADMAIIDMADNANKMGSDMTAIQNAYQGFAKQNYTMLDNLKLGYGGTKEEMERLLSDAEKLTGIKYDISNLADVYNAIHAIQTELGITGTTAEEASTTISGSWNMVKASWQDLLTSIAGGGKGLSESISALVDSAKTFIGNLLPVVKEALYGVGDLIKELAPIIAEELPGLIAEVTPMLIEAAMSIVMALTAALPELISSIMETVSSILPQISATVVELLGVLVGTIIPALLQLAGDLVMNLAQALLDNIDILAGSAISLITGLIQFLTENLPMLITIAVQIVTSIAAYIAQNAPMIITGIVILLQTLILCLVENLPLLIQAGLTILMGLVDGLIQNMPMITDAVVLIIFTLIETIFEHLPEILLAALEIGAKIVAGIVAAIPNLIISVGKMLGIVSDTKNEIDNNANKMQESVNTYTTGISSSINGMVSNLNSKTDDMRSTLGTASSYTQQIAKDVNSSAESLTTTVHKTQSSVTISFQKIADVIEYTMKTVKDSFGGIQDAINEANINIAMEVYGLMFSFDRLTERIAEDCLKMVDAVERAMAALAQLNNAQVQSRTGAGLSGRASGGWVSAGSTYLVGELGPELITPTRSGYVHTAEETAGMLGGSSNGISITIQGDVYADERSMKQKIRNAVLSVIETELAYG